MKMTNEIKENIVFKKEVEIIISVQAQKVIASSKYNIDDFERWLLKSQKISFGGNDAALFLEYMHNEGEVNGTTPG